MLKRIACSLKERPVIRPDFAGDHDLKLAGPFPGASTFASTNLHVPHQSMAILERAWLKTIGCAGLAFIAFSSGSAGAADDSQTGSTASFSSRFSAAVSGSAAHSIAASGQVTSAILALPLSIGGVALGSAGAVSAQAAHEAMQSSSVPIGTPLVITDEVITVVPPNEALKAKIEKKSD